MSKELHPETAKLGAALREVIVDSMFDETHKAIADQAGVSTACVTRALNEADFIPHANLDTICRILAAQGYRIVLELDSISNPERAGQ